MRKRCCALVLCVLLVLSVLPVTASAAENEGRQIIDQINNTYGKILSATGTENMAGYCGLMSSYQLYFLGVDKYLNSHNGRDEFDAYRDLKVTTGGHRVRAYSAQEYTLEQALNAITCNGTRNAYNILLGFQATTTEEGSKYGHASVIHAIIDGKVYFMENFDSALGGKEGTPIVCSLSRLVQFYSDWTTFEGAVEFGKKPYADRCEHFATALFVQARQPLALLEHPCEVDCDEIVNDQIREIRAGERLVVTGLYRNPDEQYYYEVDDSGTVGYISAEGADVLQADYDRVAAKAVDAPYTVKPGEDVSVSGMVSAGGGLLNTVAVVVKDQDGQTVLSYEKRVAEESFLLEKSDANVVLDFSGLAEGVYTYEILAEVANHYIDGAKVQTLTQTLCVWSSRFRVGTHVQVAPQKAVKAQTARAVPNGWVYEDGNWYYYENGAPKTGWFVDQGIDYYLTETGAAATGWTEVYGKLRFFSQTGALRTGWWESEKGLRFMMDNGVAATGWRVMDEKRYYFDANGILCANGWLDTGLGKFYLQPDGQPVTGWITLPEGRFCFHEEDGHLLAQAVEEDGKTVMRVYESEGNVLLESLKVK